MDLSFPPPSPIPNSTGVSRSPLKVISARAGTLGRVRGSSLERVEMHWAFTWHVAINSTSTAKVAYGNAKEVLLLLLSSTPRRQRKRGTAAAVVYSAQATLEDALGLIWGKQEEDPSGADGDFWPPPRVVSSVAAGLLSAS